MSILLKAKHWHLFAIYFSPLVIQIVLGSLLAQDYYFFIVLIFFALALVMAYCWNWSVALILDSGDYSHNRVGFKICFFFPIVYILLLVPILTFAREYFSMAYFLLPHVASLMAILYCYFYAARNLLQAGRSQGIEVGETFNIFMAILFFPIGIWFLQPKVNAIYKLQLD